MRLLIALLLATSLFAQTANVIELQPADSARAQKAWAALQKAQKDWDGIQEDLRRKYTLVKSGDPEASNESTTIDVTLIGDTTGIFTLCEHVLYATGCPEKTEAQKAKEKKEQQEWNDAHERYYRRGFERGFELSRDFKFIVPKPPEPVQTPPSFKWYANPATLSDSVLK